MYAGRISTFSPPTCTSTPRRPVSECKIIVSSEFLAESLNARLPCICMHVNSTDHEVQHQVVQRSPRKGCVHCGSSVTVTVVTVTSVWRTIWLGQTFSFGVSHTFAHHNMGAQSELRSIVAAIESRMVRASEMSPSLKEDLSEILVRGLRDFVHYAYGPQSCALFSAAMIQLSCPALWASATICLLGSMPLRQL